MLQVVFDLDGTLVDSTRQIVRTTQALVAELTGKRPTLAEVAAREGGTFETTLANHGFRDPAALPALLARWGELALAYRYRAFPGVARLLAALERHGARLSLWTARDRRSAEAALAQARLARFFGARVAAWNPGTPKPDPRGLAALVGDAPPERVVVVGDGWTDLRGAREYGATPVTALWSPHADERRLRAEGASRLARHPRECMQWIVAEAATR